MVIEAARAQGIEIPHFCWHPKLSVVGNCRMCLVEIEKMPKLAIACSTQVAEGMVVHTANERVIHCTPGGDGVPPDQSSAGLPDLRRSGGVQAAGLRLLPQHRREQIRRGQGPQTEARGAWTKRAARHRALHHVLALRPVLRRDREETAAHVHPARRPRGAYDVPRGDNWTIRTR